VRGEPRCGPVGGYFSDYDVLVIVKSPKVVEKHDLWSMVEQRAASRLGQTALSLIVHDVEDVNRQLELGQYFFSDIKKEGIVLYDAGGISLSEAKQKAPDERRRYARQNYEQWFTTAGYFLDDAMLNMEKGRYNQAAFYLHQATERYYTAALLVLTEYKPKTHNLDELGKRAAAFAPSLRDVFPRTAPEDERLFKLLKKAYIDARYSTKYAITEGELRVLAERVRDLRERVEKVCRERIEGTAGA
jgi:uncharacterized protein